MTLTRIRSRTDALPLDVLRHLRRSHIWQRSSDRVDRIRQPVCPSKGDDGGDRMDLDGVEGAPPTACRNVTEVWLLNAAHMKPVPGGRPSAQCEVDPQLVRRPARTG